MPTKIPASFDRIKTTKIPAADGWVYARPANGGERYVVTATGERSQTVDRRDVYCVVRELVDRLGGPVPHMPGPPRDSDDWRYAQGESTQQIVNTLLEST